MTDLHVPDVTGLNTLAAALAYADAGWFVHPVKYGTKNPGGVLGKDWQNQSSRDPQQLAAWFAGTNHLLGLNPKMSGCAVMDVDHPASVPPILMRALLITPGPHQQSRLDDPLRGHYPYRVTTSLGDGNGALGVGWGEVRSNNVLVAPSVHPGGGEYRWVTIGAVPLIPQELDDAIRTTPPRTASSGIMAAPGVSGEPIPHGQHDNTLTAYAAHLVGLGKDMNEALPLLLARFGDCVPPWDEGRGTASEERAIEMLTSALAKFSQTDDIFGGGYIGEVFLGDDAPTRGNSNTSAPVMATGTVWITNTPPSGPDPFADDIGPRSFVAPAPEMTPGPPGVRLLRVVPASDIAMQACDWLWEYEGEFWIPLGGLVLLGGREGVGKSTWTARLVAQVTNGKMNGEYLNHPRGVVISATEDAWEYTIIPRLVAAGADLRRVFRVDAQMNDITCGLTLPTDMGELAKLVVSEQIALIVLDPLLGAVEGHLDTHKDSDVRKALEPITRLAHESRSTVLGLIHQNKSQGGDLLTRMMGSRAFSAVARAVLVCASAPPTQEGGEFNILAPAPVVTSNRESYLFGQLKNNLGPRVRTSVRYEIESATVGTDPHSGKPIRTSRIKVVDYADDLDVEESVLAKERDQRDGADGRRKQPGESVHDKCVEWLKSALEAGPMLSADLKDGAAKASFNEAAYKKAIRSMDLVRSGEYHAPIYSLPVWSPGRHGE